MLTAVGFLTLLAAGEGFFAAPPRLTAGGWLAVGFIGVGSGIGYGLWLWALRHATPTRVTVCLALSPITAAVLGRVLLDEPFGLAAWLGLALVVAALWLTLSPTEPSDE